MEDHLLLTIFTIRLVDLHQSTYLKIANHLTILVSPCLEHESDNCLLRTMNWDDAILLGPDEVISGRPFSHPDAGAGDIRKIRQMTEKLRTLLADLGRRLEQEKALILDLEDDQGARDRIILPRPTGLRNEIEVAAVGFFGRIRDDLDHTPLMAIEEELVSRLPGAPGLLTYYNRYHPQEGFGNLVLFESEKDKHDWRDIKPHAEAVRLTPRHYRSVRLHNGIIQGGVLNGGDFILQRTKYYDFQGETAWLAIRYYSGQSSNTHLKDERLH